MHSFYDEWTATIYAQDDGWHVLITNRQDFEVASAETRHMCPFETAKEAAEWAHGLAATVRIRDAAWHKHNLTDENYDSLLAYLVEVGE